jgi:pimeloyl-ACP methyl ester carboxylesterase
MSEKPPIVLIHGLWMTPTSWDTWAGRFRAAGHEVLVPGWPGVDGRSVTDIRRDPSALRGLGIRKVVDSYERIVRALPEAPVIMRHSFGGLFAQMLADRGLGTSIVGVAPAQPAGITTLPGSVVRSGLPILRNPFAKNAASPITKAHFHYTFGNDLTREQSDRIWREQAINSANRVFFEGVSAAFNEKGGASHVDYLKPGRAPLLLIAGEKDHVVPPAVIRAFDKRYQAGPSPVEYREFAGRTHRTVSQDGWEPIADFALEWALAHRK